MAELRWQPLIRRGAGRGYAAVRRAVDVDARRTAGSLGRGRRVSLEAWHRQTSQRHRWYREAHPPASGAAAIVCVSQRPERLAEVVAAVERQRDVDVEFVLVPTTGAWNLGEVDAVVARLPRSTVVWDCRNASLGAALNAGLDEATERFVAKMDDDDHYGANYLVDALRAHNAVGAAIVGKHSYYVDIADRPGRLLRFPGNDFRYTSTVAGGTLVIDRDQIGDLRFEDVSLGEDRAFIEATLRRGRSVFAADRFNFVQHRGTDNTWRPPADSFLAGCVEVDGPEHMVDR